MGDYSEPNQSQTDGVSPVPSTANVRHESEGSAFQSQFEYLSQPHLQTQTIDPYSQHAFDMGSLAGNLPQIGTHQLNQRGPYGPGDTSTMLSPAAIYQMQQASQYAGGRGLPIDLSNSTRAHQQHYPPYNSLPHQTNMMQRPPIPTHAQSQYGQFDPYGYGMGQMAMQPMDPRYGPQSSFGMSPNMTQDFPPFSRRASEPAPVPSFPRGPPRKPKQSGHALWVGNLPPAANVTDLKDHFSRDATKDIESLFLISKSNCAFVNYRSEAACVAAMNRFHDSRFGGVRLVCRLRRGAASGMNASPTAIADLSETPSSNESPTGRATPAESDEPLTPTIVGSNQSQPTAIESQPNLTDGEQPQRVPEKFFIVKSLTVQDLEASVRNGIWATQSHNEATLNRAYEEAENVYLIFSANKSGEYFGYARMASTISGEPVNLSSTSTTEEARSPGAPQSIPTLATTTAPKGRIIDDSARGTIFWEAVHSDEEEDDGAEKESGEASSGQNWGRQFGIEWLSTSRLPFYRTRGLRNPWNANREVKIARDGTELESSVGRRLIQMFHRPSPGPMPPQAGMPYR